MNKPVTDLVSFHDYKINYNHCLGAGVFGVVYDLVKRPDREKGFLTYWCPQTYDYLFPANVGTPSVDLCVKISKSAWRILYEQTELTFPIRSWTEAADEEKSLAIARKNGLTTVYCYPTNCSYVSFRTKINGFNFEECHHKNLFYDQGHFKLRKAFVEFLTKIAMAKMIFADVTAENIMYDEKQEQWSIVDGMIEEANEPYEYNIEKFIGTMRPIEMDHVTSCVFDVLAKAAHDRIIYEEKHDRELFGKINLSNLSIVQ
jgi:hypothetical protein